MTLSLQDYISKSMALLPVEELTTYLDYIGSQYDGNYRILREGNLLDIDTYLNETEFGGLKLISQTEDKIIFEPPNDGGGGIDGLELYKISLGSLLNAPIESPNLDLVDNSILDLTIEDKSTSTSEDQTSEDHSDDWEDGIAKHGSNYDAWMDPNILNVDGYFNVDPSHIVTDGYRPGNQELSDFNLHDNIADTAGEMYDNFTDPLGGPDFRLFDFNNQQADAVNFINIDPLVIDLDGDGIELLDYTQARVYYDVDNDGFVEKTGWVSADDGMLAYDKNQDGVINDITELFSEYMSDNASNGLEALAEYDSNSDGVFDGSDTIFNDVRVWQDINVDGVVDEGELHTLVDLGIASINLGGTNPNGEILAGNEILARSSLATTSGQILGVAAVNFLVDPMGHEWQDDGNTGAIIYSEAGVNSYIVEDTAGVNISTADKGVSSLYGNSGNDTLIGDGGINVILITIREPAEILFFEPLKLAA